MNESEDVAEEVGGADGGMEEGQTVNFAVGPVSIGVEGEELEGLFVLSRELESLG